MTWTPWMRGILALALVQALLGVGLAIRGPGDDGVSLDDPDAAPASEIPGAPTSGEGPGAPVEPTPAPPPGESPPGVGTDPTIPPAAAGRPQAPPPLKLHGTYKQLKPDEQRRVASDPPYEPMVEGRLVDGTFWRLSAYQQPTAKICFETSRWDPRRNSGGSGGGGHTGCKGNSEWNWGMTASGDRYVALVGYAPLDAQEIQLVTKEGGTGRVGGVFKAGMGVSFFAAWIECGGPDLDRLDALDANGKVLSSLSFRDFPQGMPSWFCDFIKESG